ncbi:MAG: conserved hypothetical protein [Candidatus Desulfovibrio kirbyi]|uniref:Lipoprotein n=1 Tax=Candidatus Desulfovibrio kirbyi TaxID=2696086 RepID=A0A6L2R4C2_9BACT|nr:MAG: conserved hypothetical protein [Candidatus Desulfovibrio kirbyi]
MEYAMKLLPIFLTLVLAGGCTSTSKQTSEQETRVETAQTTQGSRSVESEKVQQSAKTDKKTAKADVKPTKGAKTEAAIRAELEATGRNLVGQAARTLRPSKSEKNVKKVGNAWVASYLEVDIATVSTQMHVGSASGRYVGTVVYHEKVYECRGASKQAALSALCNHTHNRSINEMIYYDGKIWHM